MSMRVLALLLSSACVPMFTVGQSHTPPPPQTSATSSASGPAAPQQEVQSQNSPPSREIDGHLEDASGRPVSGAMVELHDWNGAALGAQVTNAIGFFTFHVTSSGPFEVQVMTADGQERIPLESADLHDAVVRLAGPTSTPTAGGIRSKSPTVSLNDLQASGKARSKLAAAQKALDKFDLDQAWKLVNEAISAAPNWGRAHLMRGVLSLHNRNFSAARTDLDVAVKSNPNDAMALTELGKLYSTTGDLELSGVYLRRALNLQPVLWPTYLEMSSLDLKQGNYLEAQKMADDALYATPPPPPTAHYLAAEAADRLGDTKTAAAEYRSFVALQPPTPEMEPSLAAAHRRIAAIAKSDPHPE